eukprot:m51a1_g11633 hypothetical protein (94) ;mRNA; f:28-445
MALREETLLRDLVDALPTQSYQAHIAGALRVLYMQNDHAAAKQLQEAFGKMMAASKAAIPELNRAQVSIAALRERPYPQPIAWAETDWSLDFV